ncbi:MAG: DUF4389 domain-containing protein [Candidatus Heimdallarchaeaceae archaeon]
MNFVYRLLAIFVMLIYGVIISLTSFVNCLTVVCTKSRWETHYNMVTKLALWSVHISMYLANATDDTPPACP